MSICIMAQMLCQPKNEDFLSIFKGFTLLVVHNPSLVVQKFWKFTIVIQKIGGHPVYKLMPSGLNYCTGENCL